MYYLGCGRHLIYKHSPSLSVNTNLICLKTLHFARDPTRPLPTLFPVIEPSLRHHCGRAILIIIGLIFLIAIIKGILKQIYL